MLPVFTTQRKDPETGQMREVRVPESVAITGQLGAHYVWTVSGVAAYAPENTIERFGTKGALTYHLDSHRITLGRVDPSRRVRPAASGPKQTAETVEIPANLRGTWKVEEDFVAAIREGKPVYPSFDDGVAYMEFVDAVARSYAEGRTITLPLA